MSGAGLVTSYTHDMKKNVSSSAYVYPYPRICKSYVNDVAQGSATSRNAVGLPISF